MDKYQRLRIFELWIAYNEWRDEGIAVNNIQSVNRSRIFHRVSLTVH